MDSIWFEHFWRQHSEIQHVILLQSRTLNRYTLCGKRIEVKPYNYRDSRRLCKNCTRSKWYPEYLKWREDLREAIVDG